MFRKRESAPKMKKNMKMMPIPVDFRMSRLFRFIPFIRLQGHVRSREPLLTLFHVIDVGFNFGNVQFLHFWEKSLKMKLKNYKTELNSLRRGLIRSRTFKTPKMDLFGLFETIRVCSKNSGNSKNLEIGKIIQNDSMRLANSSLFSWLSILEEASNLVAATIWVWNIKNIWLKWDSNPRPRRDWSLNPTP